MNTKQIHLSGAALAFFLATACQANTTTAAQANAQPVTKTKIVQTAATPKKAVKSAKASKKTVKTAKASRTKAAPPAPVAVQPANPYLSGQSTNPYLANQPANPFLAAQANNPYLAYRNVPASNSGQTASASNYSRSAASGVVQRSTPSKISFAPMPVTMYLQPNQRPTMAIATPCSAMEKMTGNNPMFKAMEQMAFGMIGNMNEAGFMPMIIEPVCT